MKLANEEKQVAGLDRNRQDFGLKVGGWTDDVGKKTQAIDDITQYFRTIESEALLVEKEANLAGNKRDAGPIAKAQQQRNDELNRYSQSDKQADTFKRDIKTLQQTLEQMVKTLRAADDDAANELRQAMALQQEFKTAGPELANEERKAADLVESITRTRAAYTDQQKRVQALIQKINATTDDLDKQKDHTITQLNRTGAAIDHAKIIGPVGHV